jgi:hypothetical protein
MVVYVRLEPNEYNRAKKQVSEFKNGFVKMHNAALDYKKVNSQKRRSNTGMILKIREVEAEVEKINAMLPRLDEKPHTIIAKSTKSGKLTHKEKKSYSDELQELKKRIAGLK